MIFNRNTIIALALLASGACASRTEENPFSTLGSKNAAVDYSQMWNGQATRESSVAEYGSFARKNRVPDNAGRMRTVHIGAGNPEYARCEDGMLCQQVTVQVAPPAGYRLQLVPEVVKNWTAGEDLARDISGIDDNGSEREVESDGFSDDESHLDENEILAAMNAKTRTLGSSAHSHESVAQKEFIWSNDPVRAFRDTEDVQTHLSHMKREFSFGFEDAISVSKKDLLEQVEDAGHDSGVVEEEVILDLTDENVLKTDPAVLDTLSTHVSGSSVVSKTLSDSIHADSKIEAGGTPSDTENLTELVHTDVEHEPTLTKLVTVDLKSENGDDVDSASRLSTVLLTKEPSHLSVADMNAKIVESEVEDYEKLVHVFGEQTVASPSMHGSEHILLEDKEATQGALVKSEHISKHSSLENQEAMRPALMQSLHLSEHPSLQEDDEDDTRGLTKRASSNGAALLHESSDDMVPIKRVSVDETIGSPLLTHTARSQDHDDLATSDMDHADVGVKNGGRTQSDQMYYNLEEGAMEPSAVVRQSEHVAQPDNIFGVLLARPEPGNSAYHEGADNNV